jgi:transcriptional regulator with XRE-family HTH domain
MKITSNNTDDAVLAELGARLARTRLERNLTQAQLAAEAGVGKATVERIEAGEPANVPSLIRVLRVLGLLEGLDRLIPEPVPSPIERLKLHGRQRQRAAPARVGSPGDDEPEPAPWRWGDEP